MIYKLLTALLCLLLLTGCTPPRVHGDTVIQIPVSRKEAATEETAAAVQITTAPTSAPETTVPETEAPETEATKPPRKPGRPPKRPKPPKPPKSTEAATEAVPTEPAATDTPAATETPTATDAPTVPDETGVPPTDAPDKVPSDPPESTEESSGSTVPSGGTAPETNGATAPDASLPAGETGQTETVPATGPDATEPAPTDTPAADPTDPTEFTFPDPYDLRNYAPWGYEAMVTEACNAIREEAGLPPLTEDPYLSAIASVRGYEVTLSAGSTRPDGRAGSSVLGDYGYPASRYLEYRGQVSGGEIAFLLSLWVEDPGFRQMLQDPDCTTIGIGFFDSDILTSAVLILV